MNEEPRVLILFAHPALHKSRVNRRLIMAVRAMPGVTFHDLYETYPDFLIDVKREQDLLRRHDVVVFHHPMYWYSSPAILKEWQDLVLEYGFAFGDGGDVLQGKTLVTVTTTGASKRAYTAKGMNGHQVIDLLLPFRQTASLCGMNYMPPFVIYGTHRLNEAAIPDYVAEYKSFIEALRDGAVEFEHVKNLCSINERLDQILDASAAEQKQESGK